MCNIGQALGIAPKPVDTAAIERKAKAEAEAAATRSAQAANAKLAQKNRSRNLSLLATGAGESGMQPGAGKPTLGA